MRKGLNATNGRSVTALNTGRSGPQISVDAHNDDVNVISWSRSVTYLLASGCEDGSFKVRSNTLMTHRQEGLHRLCSLKCRHLLTKYLISTC